MFSILAYKRLAYKTTKMFSSKAHIEHLHLKVKHHLQRNTYCRNGFYANTEIKRFPVPDSHMFLNDEFPDYAPVEYTSPTVFGKPWADLDSSDPLFKPQWNTLDGNVQRKSLNWDYIVDDNNRPINNFGRTGITGRGLLGRWGPNFAVDLVVTRWKNDPENPDILQYVAIQRKDTKQWAIPGGMIDVGETVAEALHREFMEEAMNLKDTSGWKCKKLKKHIDDMFLREDFVYKGYVDDPRNTDNAWIETTVLNVHDNDGTILEDNKLEAGDDACKVQWMDIHNELETYSHHGKLLKLIARLRNARWEKKD